MVSVLSILQNTKWVTHFFIFVETLCYKKPWLVDHLSQSAHICKREKEGGAVVWCSVVVEWKLNTNIICLSEALIFEGSCCQLSCLLFIQVAVLQLELLVPFFNLTLILIHYASSIVDICLEFLPLYACVLDFWFLGSKNTSKCEWT